MNLVFAAFLVIVAAGALWTWRRANRYATILTREGPVPGYSHTKGEAIALPDDLPLERGAGYDPISIETFNSPNRSRVVLSFALGRDVDLEAARAFAAGCAASVATRSRARVVFVELQGEGRRSYYLWAPDGRGWTGGEPVRELFVPGVQA